MRYYLDMASRWFKKILNSSGFTLFEMLMSMSIISLIAATLILYTRTGEQQITLFKEQAKVLNMLVRTRNLGITSFIKSASSTSFATSSLPCGYGMHFEISGEMTIFQDMASDCALADHIYSGVAEAFESSTLAADISFDSLSLTDVVFVPPQPLVFITPLQDQALITLTTGGVSPSTASVTVSTANQISIQ